MELYVVFKDNYLFINLFIYLVKIQKSYKLYQLFEKKPFDLKTSSFLN